MVKTTNESEPPSSTDISQSSPYSSSSSLDSSLDGYEPRRNIEPSYGGIKSVPLAQLAPRPHAGPRYATSSFRLRDLIRRPDSPSMKMTHPCPYCGKNLSRRDAIRRHVISRQCPVATEKGYGWPPPEGLVPPFPATSTDHTPEKSSYPVTGYQGGSNATPYSLGSPTNQTDRNLNKPVNVLSSIGSQKKPGAHSAPSGSRSSLGLSKSPVSEVHHFSEIENRYPSNSYVGQRLREKISQVLSRPIYSPPSTQGSDISPPNSHCSSQCSSPGNAPKPIPQGGNGTNTSAPQGIAEELLDYETLMADMKRRHFPEREPIYSHKRPNNQSRQTSFSSLSGEEMALKSYACALCHERFRNQNSLHLHLQIHELEERIRISEQHY
ncbi:hypothetical protein FRC14_000308 [Serendipita sp. 396]|nr:hypothetical protein FRC14_000308 [Serendipita sp. 396]KAG8801449.1 hypothetical protein FRC16_000442 [Serendipita sp. 398]KAG8818904.1 hypothetical protein FRC19_010249 [Serendipita sp. 401]KAG8846492.1 hypothetical protein FRB91_000752 [Serendipita sp. 411]KAG8870087.1 hypothetical protein FRC20_000406 [Serendipita sp. 405]